VAVYSFVIPARTKLLGKPILRNADRFNHFKVAR
jgi:hypothetical protein